MNSPGKDRDHLRFMLLRPHDARLDTTEDICPFIQMEQLTDHQSDSSEQFCGRKVSNTQYGLLISQHENERRR